MFIDLYVYVNTCVLHNLHVGLLLRRYFGSSHRVPNDWDIVVLLPSASAESTKDRTSRTYVVHFVSMRGVQVPSFRLSEPASCFALRLPSRLLYLPSSGLNGDAVHPACNACSASELLAAECGSADTHIPSRYPRYSCTRLLLFTVMVTEDGFAGVSPLEAPVQVGDMPVNGSATM